MQTNVTHAPDIDQIKDYVYNDKPIASTVSKGWLQYLLQDRQKLIEGLDQIANYKRDQYESPLHAYDNCKQISRSILKEIGESP